MGMYFVKDWFCKPSKKTYQGIWVPKKWNGVSMFLRNYVFTDGSDMYLSDYNNRMYILNREDSTWNLIGALNSNMESEALNIWTDGNVARYANYQFSYQYDYAYDKSQNLWTLDYRGYPIKDSIYGIEEPIYGKNIFSAGEDVYYLNNYFYKLDKTDSKWVSVGYKDGIYGQQAWADGEKIYFSNASTQYEYNQTDRSWVYKSWSGLGSTKLYGMYIWSDGNDMFYSNNDNHYVLNRTSSQWLTKTWSGLTNFSGDYIWKDGDHIYYSKSTYQYELT